MLKLSHVAVALSFVLVAAAGCGNPPPTSTGTTTGGCNPGCGANQTCNADGTCSCYSGYQKCVTDADAGIFEDGGGAQGFVCVNLELDNNNCGSCGAVCGDGEACLGHQCQCKRTECVDDGGTSVCTDPETDRRNCGTCGNQCPAGETCTLGICTCVPSLTIAQCDTDAGLACIDLTQDNNNCGGCGNQCAGNQQCDNPGGGTGVCICKDGGPGTAIDNCNQSCTDTARDPFNCGACGVVCVSGSCSLNDAGVGACNCPSPYTQCTADCVDTFSDIYHCGNCDNDCTIIGSGIPELACNLGHCYCGPTSQGTICGDGVCAKLSTDKENCGGCGNICIPPAQDCVNGTCACPDGDALCGSPDAGIPLFCINTTQNDLNCGTCANVCNDTYAAASGCRFGICTCSPGQSTLCTDLPSSAINPTCTCVSDSKAGSASSPCGVPSFATDVYPLLAQQTGTFGCAASGCHGGTNPGGGLAFLDPTGHMDSGMAYAELLGTAGAFSFGDGGIPFCDAGIPSNGPSQVCACVSRVTPGFKDSSYLVDVLNNDLPCDAGAAMPEDDAGGWVPLSACSKQLIEQWIDMGANP